MDAIVRRVEICGSVMESDFNESMNFAEIPQKVELFFKLNSKIETGDGYDGLPSYSKIVALDAKTDISQFHIIHVVVV